MLVRFEMFFNSNKRNSVENLVHVNIDRFVTNYQTWFVYRNFALTRIPVWAIVNSTNYSSSQKWNAAGPNRHNFANKLTGNRSSASRRWSSNWITCTCHRREEGRRRARHTMIHRRVAAGAIGNDILSEFSDWRCASCPQQPVVFPERNATYISARPADIYHLLYAHSRWYNIRRAFPDVER